MRKLVIGMAMASTALTVPAHAREDAWYVELNGGVAVVEDIDLDINGVAGDLSVGHDEGFDFGGIVGYDFGGARLEAEVSYREADIEGITAGADGFPGGGPVRLARNGIFPANGDTSNLAFMINGLADFGPDDGLQAFVGGGVGVARTDVGATVNTALPDGFDDSDTGFAYQLLAGVRAPLTETIDVGLKYRMLHAAGCFDHRQRRSYE